MSNRYEDDDNIRFLQLTKAQIPYVYSMEICDIPLPANYNMYDYVGDRFSDMNIYLGDGSGLDNALVYNTETEDTFEISKYDDILAGYRIKLIINASAMGLSIGDEFVFNGALYGEPPVVYLTEYLPGDPWISDYPFVTNTGYGRYKVISNTVAVCIDPHGSGKFYIASGRLSAYYNTYGRRYSDIQSSLNDFFDATYAHYNWQYVNDNPVRLLLDDPPYNVSPYTGMGLTKSEIETKLANYTSGNVTEISILYNSKQLWSDGDSPGIGTPISTRYRITETATDEFANSPYTYYNDFVNNADWQSIKAAEDAKLNALWQTIKDFADAQDVPCMAHLIVQVCTDYLYWLTPQDYTVKTVCTMDNGWYEDSNGNVVNQSTGTTFKTYNDFYYSNVSGDHIYKELRNWHYDSDYTAHLLRNDIFYYDINPNSATYLTEQSIKSGAYVSGLYASNDYIHISRNTYPKIAWFDSTL